MKNFKRISYHKLKKLSEDERRNYYLKSKEYYGNLENQLKNYKMKDLIHPVLLFAVNHFVSPFSKNIHILNDMPVVSDNSKIYISNHSNAKDFIVLSKIIKEHFFILADYTMINDPFVNALNKSNGCVYVDRESKKSGETALKQVIEGVNNGYSTLLFPETTWSLLPNQPILPRKWGDVKIAQSTGKPIIPIILDYNGDNCYVKYGQPIYVKPNDDIVKVDRFLQRLMQNLKDEIRESKIYKENYIEIPYDEWLIKTIKSYKYFDVKYETSLIRKDDDYYKDEFKYIMKII